MGVASDGGVNRSDTFNSINDKKRNIGGLEVLKIVRTSVANRKTPVIIVSVLADSDTMIVCQSLGIGDYIVKPVVRETLLASVRKQLAGPQRTSLYGA